MTPKIQTSLIDEVQIWGKFASSERDLLYWSMNVSKWEAEKEQARFDMLERIQLLRLNYR